MTNTPLPTTMNAMILTGHGGMDRYDWRADYPVPTPAPGEVLVRVGACGFNNTDVNTRTGWYSKAVTEATSDDGYADMGEDDPAWGGAALQFPRIQGADICGHVVAVGAGVDPARIGERIISDCWLRDPDDLENKEKSGYLGSERDGGFAQFCTMPARNAVPVQCDLTDAELATFSCSYSTAEGMLTRAQVGPQDRMLVPGASGGVGGALVQLAKRRGAQVVALASASKHAAVQALGADEVWDRDTDLQTIPGPITVVADIVGGPGFGARIDRLARGGRYVTSGAIAGPMVELDLRTLYLRDLSFFGSTVIDLDVMARLVSYIEDESVQPALAASYPLAQLREAQQVFIDKTHSGNIVVLP